MAAPRIAGLLLAGGLLLGGAAAGAADTWRFDAYHDLMSPFCPGRTLSDCPSQQAEELRQWIARQEEAGRSRAEVEADLRALYGDVILSAPRAEGWGLTAYLLPIAAFLAGGLLVVLFLRRQAARGRAEEARPAALGPVDPELERRMERELGPP